MISLTSPIETWGHRQSPYLKLATLCLSTLVLFWQDSFVFHILAFAGVLLLYRAPGQVFFRVGLKRIWALWPFVLVMFVWHAVTGDLSAGLVVILRLMTAVGLANLVTMTTRLTDMMEVVKWLATPLRHFGISTRALELGMALVIRFTPVLVDKGALLSQSWRSRSARRPNWRIVLPFAVLAIDDAEHVAEALKARGGL